MSVGLALIGSGHWARDEHLPAILASKHLQLKAVYSRTTRSARTIAERAPGIDLYSEDGECSFADILKREDISALLISLPIGSQASYIKAGLSAGKHVLSEKPVAENLQQATELIDWYRSSNLACTWSVAENWRFLRSFDRAAEEIKKLGKIIGFQVRHFTKVDKDWKFFNTDWRKTPTHQGGFLLDGGVHLIAGLRQLLEAGNERLKHVSAFTNSIEEYLPPVDTINAIVKTESGISGTLQISFGTTLRGNEWTVACENGVVSVIDVLDSVVTVMVDGKKTILPLANEKTGVPPEVRVWGKALANGTALKAQEPESARADLEIIELILRSGEKGGFPMDCRFQKV
ncbi:uncharacterized protein PV09_05778 [Verruconis gallopava]|uniref:Gfo/Idh/MocA-like oxidoreductase N-terminal domain-containing protein n=1 Tax=Verruconis gallopava TaxID=253628 RepID=A0A0D1XL71_9PEZI|nr:uncharacterized protein PV09_05778 [Verruconis gallopava]KIW03136.1 hypothetical protein PV09_05778 [Verruconis gallopava]